MSSRRTLGRSRIAATGALGLVVLLAVGGVAQPRSTHRTARPHAPLRAIVYLTTPIRAGGAPGRPVPSVSRDDSAGRRAASVCARVGPRRRRDRPLVARSPADRKLAAVLAAIASTHAHVRGVALLDRPHGSEALQIAAARDVARRRLPDTSASVRDPRFSSHPQTMPSAPASVRVAGEQRRARSGSRWRPSRATHAAAALPTPGFRTRPALAAHARAARS